MTGIITFAVIIIWIVLRNKKRAIGGGRDKSMPNMTVTTAQNSSGQRTNTQTIGRSGSTGSYRKAPEKRDADDAREDGHSTTAYLMEKAEADAREHAKEKMEEQRRLQSTRGGLAVAERLYDGDPVPQGKRCVVCGYCGAENLVPLASRMGYSCYFCREPLK